VGILIKELISSKSQVKIERLKIYESEMFKAYIDLYQFIRFAESCWEPGFDRGGFIDLIKSNYFKKVQENMLFYSSEIQKDLELLELYYKALGDPDLIVIGKPFMEFIDTDFLGMLFRLETSVKRLTNQIIHK